MTGGKGDGGPGMSTHEPFMAEALALAERGLGAVEPNPPVGAVIVREGRVLGRGWHKRFGGPHAEVEAIADAGAAGGRCAGATMYVTLEPCCHHGKTPPCTEAIVEAGISAVVASMTDPFGRVAGGGFQALRAAGVDVTEGVLADPAGRLLGPYTKLLTQRRPWVICKWAQTLDGRIAARSGHSQWISCRQARLRGGELRGLCDGVAVGIGTAVADDPLLTNRSGAGRKPVRVVLDDDLRLRPESRLVRSITQAPLLVATTAEAVASRRDLADTLVGAGAELLHLPGTDRGVDIAALLDELGRRRWTRLLIEGGSSVLGSVLGAGLADELRVFLAPRILGGREGLPCVGSKEVDDENQATPPPEPEVEKVGCDLMLTYRFGGG